MSRKVSPNASSANGRDGGLSVDPTDRLYDPQAERRVAKSLKKRGLRRIGWVFAAVVAAGSAAAGVTLATRGELPFVSTEPAPMEPARLQSATSMPVQLPGPAPVAPQIVRAEPDKGQERIGEAAEPAARATSVAAIPNDGVRRISLGSGQPSGAVPPSASAMAPVEMSQPAMTTTPLPPRRPSAIP